MFDDRDRRPPEERPPIREPKPSTSPQREYGEPGRRIEKGEQFNDKDIAPDKGS